MKGKKREREGGKKENRKKRKEKGIMDITLLSTLGISKSSPNFTW
jgi:hypothetical protein